MTAARREEDARWMAAAIALSERARGRTAPNPNVGCIIVREGRVVGRGWTQPGGRPHAEAEALAQAGASAAGATVYVTLEPCAHASARGPACADLLAEARPARVVAAVGDPDPRTDGRGLARLREAGVAVEVGAGEADARRAMAGFLTRRALGRPFVTLKLATSLDGRIALADGTSRWITGEAARAHVHLERSRHEAILVGRGTWEADRPRLDVRLAGLEDRSPRQVMLSGSGAANPSPFGLSPSKPCPSSRPEEEGGKALRQAQGERGEDVVSIGTPEEIGALEGVDHLLVEGGAGAAAAFLRADLVDRLLLYRAPIVVGGGLAAVGDIGLGDLAEAHGRWRLYDARMLGSDRVEVYERARS